MACSLARPSVRLRLGRTRRTLRDALVATPAVVAVGLIVLSAGCGKDATRPGESVGAFHVTGALVSSTCGATPNPWAFDVNLRHDANTLYWVQGDAPVSAPVDSKAHATLTFSNTETVRLGDPKTNTPACAMERADTVDLTLAPVGASTAYPAGATSFTGTLSYVFSVPDPTSSCDDQLTASGGDYATLPCMVSYTLSGTRTGDAK